MVARRSPARTLTALAVTIVCGLGSRRRPDLVPHFIAIYAGDTLWALAAFLTIGLALPRVRTRIVALAALALSFLVELSQLYHAPWIDTIRDTTIGGLLLGFGFLWSDLVCYAAGVAIGIVLDRLLLSRPCEARDAEADG
jgi:hypothetical protein